jgi:hypothetical protein
MHELQSRSLQNKATTNHTHSVVKYGTAGNKDYSADRALSAELGALVTLAALQLLQCTLSSPCVTDRDKT